MRKYKDALKDMVWQFAYRGTKGGKSIMWTGGLSALRGAFEALGWDDPKYFEDMDGVICDVEGCPGWVVAQGGIWADIGYWCVCSRHSQVYRQGKPQPKMKTRAIKREASRGEDGRLPILNT